MYLSKFVDQTKTAGSDSFFLDWIDDLFAFFLRLNKAGVTQDFKMVGDGWLGQFDIFYYLGGVEGFMLFYEK